jgi:uncharacterized phiE125 gp8 family phage protein
MANYYLQTAPTTEPISLADAKAQCRVDITEDDGYLDNLIAVARRVCEEWSSPRLAMLSQTWLYLADQFPSSDTIELEVAPLQSVTSIKYTDEDGVTTTFASTNYVVDTYSRPGRIRLKSSAAWPAVTLREVNGLVIEFVAGYGNTATAVPEHIRHAVRLLVEHWYENREPVASAGSMKEIPFTVSALMASEWIKVG